MAQPWTGGASLVQHRFGAVHVVSPYPKSGPAQNRSDASAAPLGLALGRALPEWLGNGSRSGLGAKQPYAPGWPDRLLRAHVGHLLGALDLLKADKAHPALADRGGRESDLGGSAARPRSHRSTTIATMSATPVLEEASSERTGVAMTLFPLTASDTP